MANLLNKDIKDIKPESNFFFDLGGTSLDYYNLISEITSEFQIEIKLDNESSFYTPISISKMIEGLE